VSESDNEISNNNLTLTFLFKINSGGGNEMGIFDLFKKKEPRTMLDEVQDATIQAFRNLAKTNGVPPTNKMTDKEILKISQETMTSFKEVAKQRDEHIQAGYLIAVAMKFFSVYEQFGQEFYNEHLEYELNKYLNEGLREDYKQDIKLF